ncbi:hypothetical protein OG215_36590 (plasmid) [Streptomyces globisporus]|uniref:hypothetical protein n=1 Tax=Streptomyces globisporus TaxID=1908 RepID=UPI00386690CB|nr:hypothetical protein OG215_36590 [Streptomyces globisporus]
MSKSAASGKDEKDKKAANPAGDFAVVRRRRGGPADRSASAAALLGHAETTADASFLGTGQALPAGLTTSSAPATPDVAPTQPAETDTPRSVAPSPRATNEGAPKQSTPVAPPTATEHRDPSVLEPARDAVSAARAGADTTADSRTDATADTTADSRTDATADTTADNQGSTEAAGSASARRRKAAKLAPTHQAILDSYVDSRVNSRHWDSHGVNLIPALWPALRARIARDRKSSGNSNLGLGHYLDVALRSVQLDTDYLIGLHDKLHAERMGDVPKGKKTTLSLSPAARENADALLELLEAADFARKGKDVTSAIVLNLLRTLEKEGPLPRPEVPPLI